jgi:hypothetical protein
MSSVVASENGLMFSSLKRCSDAPIHPEIVSPT